jgi:Nidogen-like
MLSWMKRQPEAKAPPRRPPLELEQLEDRSVPSAVRMLPGFTANSLPREDDSPSPQANVGFTLNFFGVQTNQVFVNNNGNITFGQPFSTFTPTALNSNNGGIPIIAPYFADVDTRGAGNVTTYGTDTLCGEQAFGVDWFNVDYFDAIDPSHIVKLSTFQLILVNRPETGAGNFDVEFNYDTITWETGDASGGTNGLGGESSAVGYSNGTGTAGTFFELPGSHVPGSFIDGGPDQLRNAILLSTTPGRLHFLVRNGQVIMTPPPMAPTVNNDVSAETRVFYPFRWITDDATTGMQHGNLTLINVGGQVTPTSPNNIDACLDIPTQGTGTTTTSSTFAGPITVVFPSLPPNVTIANPTGFTASGHPFITVNVSGLPLDLPVLRIRLNIDNSLSPPNAPTTFMEGFPVQTFAGTFDPTML